MARTTESGVLSNISPRLNDTKLTGIHPENVTSRGWTHSLLRSTYQPRGAVHVSVPSRSALASHALAAQSESPSALGPDAAPDQQLAASRPHLSSLSPAPPGRYHLR